MITSDEWTWLQRHNATVYFCDGHKVGLDFVRDSDGCRLQVSDWALGDAIAQAKKLDALAGRGGATP